MSRSLLSQIQRGAWRASSLAGDGRAAELAAQGHPQALVRRAIRKRAYRASGRATRKILRSFGL